MGNVPAWLLSTIVHLVLLTLLAIAYLPIDRKIPPLALNATLADAAEDESSVLEPLDSIPHLEAASDAEDDVDWMVIVPSPQIGMVGV